VWKFDPAHKHSILFIKSGVTSSDDLNFFLPKTDFVQLLIFHITQDYRNFFYKKKSRLSGQVRWVENIGNFFILLNCITWQMRSDCTLTWETWLSCHNLDVIQRGLVMSPPSSAKISLHDHGSRPKPSSAAAAASAGDDSALSGMVAGRWGSRC
jgi:hypothetical protein